MNNQRMARELRAAFDDIVAAERIAGKFPPKALNYNKVTDPDGFRISFSDRTSPSGGRLDRDANYPCGSNITSSPVENIFWPEGEALRGSYGVQVWYTSPCSTGGGPVDFTLIVRVGGRTVIEESSSLDGSGSSYTTEFGF